MDGEMFICFVPVQLEAHVTNFIIVELVKTVNTFCAKYYAVHWSRQAKTLFELRP